MKITTLLVSAIVLFTGTACGVYAQQRNAADTLPKPYATKSSRNFSNVIGWKDTEKPQAPPGFEVRRYADGFENPRWLYETPNHEILVVESNTNHPWYEQIGGWIIGASKSNNLRHSADRITVLRDTNGDGQFENREVLLENLEQPFGVLVLHDWLYVANTNALWRYPYKTGQLKITDKGQKIADLPAGKHNRHWTRNLIASEDGSKIYVAVGSGSNVAEKGIENELMRAAILQMNPDGSDLKIFAGGLRNPVGMTWINRKLWTVVNERDLLGDDLVPDYLTHVEEDAFYGWPYTYFGNHKDERVKEPAPAIVKETRVPDVSLVAHSASLGLAYINNKTFPEEFREGVLIAQHGSWNRSVLSGYRVLFVPFSDGKPSGKHKDFLTGFVSDLEHEKVHGRPVCVLQKSDGSILVTDDTSNVVWQIRATGK